MELAAVFILSVLGGWAFSLRWNLTRFTTLRAEGQHLYLRAAFYGAFLFAAALILRIILIAWCPGYEGFDHALASFITPIMKDHKNPREAELVVTAAMSLFLGPLVALLLNVVTRKNWALRRSVSFQDQLFIDAQTQELPVAITLKNGKLYVGIVRQIPDPGRPPPTLALLPMFSGYRDSTGRVVLTNDYDEIYEAVKSRKVAHQFNLPRDWERSFELSICTEQILTAAMFVPTVYAHFNPRWRDSIGAQPPPASRAELLVEIKRRPPPTGNHAPAGT